MSEATVTKLKNTIEALPQEEVRYLWEWMRENFEDDDWDRQMKEDAQAGKLNYLIDEAKEALRKRTARKFL